VNLNANIEGWKRLEPAQKWLNEHFSTATLEERQRDLCQCAARFRHHARVTAAAGGRGPVPGIPELEAEPEASVTPPMNYRDSKGGIAYG